MRGFDAILDEVRPALRSGIASLAESLLGAPNAGLSNRSEWRWGSRGSFRVTVNGHARGACADFESDWKGDPLALIQRVRGGDFTDTVIWAANWAGIDTGDRQAKPEDLTAKRARDAAREQKRIQDEAAAEADRIRRTGIARNLWQRRTDAIDTISERYVVLTRAIQIKPTGMAGCGRFPATGRPAGLARDRAGWGASPLHRPECRRADRRHDAARWHDNRDASDCPHRQCRKHPA
jgi:hypothetical protein